MAESQLENSWSMTRSRLNHDQITADGDHSLPAHRRKARQIMEKEELETECWKVQRMRECEAKTSAAACWTGPLIWKAGRAPDVSV
jgi:hypothetical protein